MYDATGRKGKTVAPIDIIPLPTPPPITDAVQPAIGIIPVGVGKHAPPVTSAGPASRTKWPELGNVTSLGLEPPHAAGDAIWEKFDSIAEDVVDDGSGDALVLGIAAGAVASRMTTKEHYIWSLVVMQRCMQPV